MANRSKREILSESPLFDNLLPPEIELLADLCTERDYAAGDAIFTEGEVGDSVFIIAEGAVEILRKSPSGGEVSLAQLSAPIFFGEMSLIDKEYRSATVRATSGARLLQLNNDNLHIFAKSYRNGFTWIVVNIARVLSSRLRMTNARLVENA